jgi:predicted GIY-YIG superfamily endonuclease
LATKSKMILAKTKYRYTIYGLQNTVTNKWYIGITRHFQLRKWQHLNSLRKGDHHSAKLQKSFDKHEENVWQWSKLEARLMTFSKAQEVEHQWIALFDSHNNGYNMTPGGDCSSNNRGTMCEWEGIVYPSIAEASRATGIDASALFGRLSRGYKSESEMIGSGGHNHQKSCVWNGVEYPSVSHAAKALGITQSAMSIRVSRGYTCDEDFRPSKREVVWNDVAYPTMKEAALALGVDAASLAERLNKGYTKDSDVRKPKTCVWNGIEYCSVQEAAKALGISDTLMYRRINRGFAQDSDLVAGSKGARVNG